jgi:hypothetical protein
MFIVRDSTGQSYFYVDQIAAAAFHHARPLKLSGDQTPTKPRQVFPTS